jgi:hypothetical protein
MVIQRKRPRIFAPEPLAQAAQVVPPSEGGRGGFELQSSFSLNRR